MTQYSQRSGFRGGLWRLSAFAASLALAACGGGYGGTAASAPPATVSLSVDPAAISLGEVAALSWTSTSASNCAASGGWSGVQAASGTTFVAPATVGPVTYTLACAGSAGASGAGGPAATATVTLAVTPASAYSASALVSQSGAGSREQDANLGLPWGLAVGTATPVWVANNATGTATAYDGNGVAQPHPVPLVVRFPVDASSTAFLATGIVFNPSTTDFVLTSGSRSATAAVLFAGESGRIGGWSGAVDPVNVVTMYVAADGAVYKGLALASHGAASFLYATDFYNAKIDVFDSHFVKQSSSAGAFAFADPSIPAGFAPFGIQAINDGPGGAAQLYVSYAKQSLPDRREHTAGAGLGALDIFDTGGVLVRQLVAAGGGLNAPWGITRAPGDFGTAGHKVLVGNAGDGTINAFDPLSGRRIGALADATGAALAFPGLWGIQFGNDAHNQPHNALFYSAGASGTVGRIDVGATAPVLGAPPVVALTAPSGTVRGLVALTASATDPLGIASVQFFVNNSTLGVVTAPPYAIPWDTTTVADGSVVLNAKAIDPDGNVAVSEPIRVTVANDPVGATLTQLQGSVFSPICSGCHSGSNPPAGPLPESQNLTAGASFATLVNVASHEQPNVLRVKPGDPAASYLIQKLEGAATIGGQRMPLGGPYLDQATIDTIKSWIAAGATNN